MDATPLPPGFIELPIPKFIAINGPLYGRMRDGRFALGFRVEDRHCNPRGVCHGGMLMTLADMLHGLVANLEKELHRFLPTIKLEADFIAPAEIGDWVEGTGEVLRMTRTLVFTQGMLRVGDKIVLRTSSLMRLPPEPDPRMRIAELFASQAQ
jgi:uncharacterized protein (TIGR00369 family)